MSTDPALIERVARALAFSLTGEENYDWTAFEGEARAAIDAMLTPSDDDVDPRIAFLLRHANDVLARVTMLEAELETLRAAHHDATEGISATIRAGELEALKAENDRLREKYLAEHCRANAFADEFDRRVRAEARVAALEARITTTAPTGA